MINRYTVVFAPVTSCPFGDESLHEPRASCGSLPGPRSLTEWTRSSPAPNYIADRTYSLPDVVAAKSFDPLISKPRNELSSRPILIGSQSTPLLRDKYSPSKGRAK